jgi:hypothetical protein
MAFIDIAGYTLVLVIHILLIMFVAINAGEIVVIAAEVAIRAGRPGVMMGSRVDREIEIVVIESGALPGNGRVAHLTGSGETGLHVVGIRGALVFGLMAEVAHCRRSLILPPHVTKIAWCVHVRTG